MSLHRSHKPYFFFSFWIVLLFLHQSVLHAQDQEEPYNRFQYHKFKWRTFHTESSHLYFPYGSDSLCKYIANELPGLMELVKYRMVTSLLSEPHIVIYPSVDQLYESNIGLFELNDKTLPTFTKQGDRHVVYFNGSKEQLKAQIMEGLVRSVWQAQFHNDLVAQVQDPNEAIPQWFQEGVIQYFAHQWPIAAEDELKRSFQDRSFNNWWEVIAYAPKLSGQAFCYFLNTVYYKEATAQLFGQLKQKRDLRRAIRLITKTPLDSLYLQCFDFYHDRFLASLNTKTTTQESLSIPRKKGIIKDILVTPSGQQVIYILHHDQTRTVYCYDLIRKKTIKITGYALPPWIKDNSKNPYPIVKTNDQRELIIILPGKKGITATHYSYTGAKIKTFVLEGLDGLTNVEPVSNQKYLLSGYRKGQSDIVYYQMYRNRYQTVTNDTCDDTYLTHQTQKNITFLSERPWVIDDTTVKIAQGVYRIKGKEIVPIVRDSLPYIRWNKPIAISNDELLVTHTLSGTEQFCILNMNTGKHQTLGAYERLQYDKDKQQVYTYHITNDSILITKKPFQQWAGNHTNGTAISPWLIDYRQRAKDRAIEDSLLQAAKSNTPSFLDGILVPKDAKEKAQQRKDSIAASLAYDGKKVKPYVLQLQSAYFTAQVNNDYFINRYQPYQNYQGMFKFPEVTTMIQGGLTDLFENHHISIGYRMPVNSEGSDFFVNYRNTAKRLDWGLTYFRKVEMLQPNSSRTWVDENGNPYPSVAKVKTHYYGLSLHYPITYYLSVGLEEAVRLDRTIFLATDNYSLTFEDLKQQWSITTLSLKQYKLKPTVPLLQKGYAIKLYSDGFKAFSQQEEVLYGINLKVEHHQPLYRYITLVTKVQAGTSGGNSNILYNMGGVDNNVTVRIDSSILFPQSAPYSFQKLITPFRGYLQNTITGNQYALLNMDVYFPIFETLYPLETPLSSINHLQLGLFTDIGATRTTWQKTVTTSGWKCSYGLSARTKLAGYPIRVDLAWPGTFNQKPVWYFSLQL